MVTAPRGTTITKLRNKNGTGGSSSMSMTMMNPFRIIVYVAVGLILVCAVALVRMTFHISQVESVQQAVAKSLAESSHVGVVGGGSSGVRGNDNLGEGREQLEDMYGQRGDDDMASGGGLFNIQNDALEPPVLPDLPPLPQGAGSLEQRIWDEKDGTYPFTGTVGCRSSISASSTTPSCLIHFPRQPNETSNSQTCQESCLRTQKGQKYADQVNQNQDRSLLIQPLRFQKNKNQPPQETSSDDASKSNFLVLLADGHGNTGHHTAEQVARDLPFRILQSLEQQLQSSPTTLLRVGSSSKSDIDVVTSILTKDFLTADVEAVKTPDGGTTGIVALRLGPSLYLAQAGDSFAFVVQWKKKSGAGAALGGAGSWQQQLAAAADGTGTTTTTINKTAATIVMEAVRHKPADPLERQRIEAAGGQVMMPPVGQPGGTSRVVIPDPNGGMLAEALAMSRSLGDENGKKLGFLTAEPSVVHADLDQLKKDCGPDCEHFLVVSSDGVLDFFSPLELANFVAFKLYQTQPPVPLEQVMADALDLAARRWRMQITMGGYRDDMTLVISKL